MIERMIKTGFGKVDKILNGIFDEMFPTEPPITQTTREKIKFAYETLAKLNQELDLWHQYIPPKLYETITDDYRDKRNYKSRTYGLFTPDETIRISENWDGGRRTLVRDENNLELLFWQKLRKRHITILLKFSKLPFRRDHIGEEALSIDVSGCWLDLKSLVGEEIVESLLPLIPPHIMVRGHFCIEGLLQQQLDERGEITSSIDRITITSPWKLLLPEEWKRIVD